MTHAIYLTFIMWEVLHSIRDISMTNVTKIPGAYIFKWESVCICVLMHDCVYDTHTEDKCE